MSYNNSTEGIEQFICSRFGIKEVWGHSGKLVKIKKIVIFRPKEILFSATIENEFY